MRLDRSAIVNAMVKKRCYGSCRRFAMVEVVVTARAAVDRSAVDRSAVDRSAMVRAFVHGASRVEYRGPLVQFYCRFRGRIATGVVFQVKASPC